MRHCKQRLVLNVVKRCLSLIFFLDGFGPQRSTFCLLIAVGGLVATEYLSYLWTWTGARVRQAHDARMHKCRPPPADPEHAYPRWAAWSISGSVTDFFAYRFSCWSASDCTLSPNCCSFLRFSASSSASPSPSTTHWYGSNGYSVDSGRTHYWPLFCYHSTPAPGLRSRRFFSKDLIVGCARFWIGHSVATWACASR